MAGGMHAGGGVHGRRGMNDMMACMAGGACVAAGHSWRGGGVHAWQERQPLQRTVCILLECILVLNLK